MNCTRKVWGDKYRLLETSNTEIDLLYLEQNTRCSIHYHDKKINRFVLIKGRVRVKTDLGEKQLIYNEPFDVCPPLIHQFIADKDSILIELAFVNKGKINNNDIIRKMQGGKIIDEKFYTLDELKENNWLEYKNVK